MSMQLNLYFQLGTQSKRCMNRSVTRTGKPYQYNPRGDLLERLAHENGLSIEGARNQLLNERQYLLRQGGIG